MAAAAWAADHPSPAATPTVCANGVPGVPSCISTPSAREEAHKAFEHGMKLQKEKRFDDAFLEFEKAASLVPQDLQYATLRELTRQHLVSEHIERGNAAMASGQKILALGEFRNALHLDPSNEFAQQRVNDAIDRSGSASPSSPQLVEESPEIVLVPKDNRMSFHFRGDSRQLLTQVASAFGITVTIDDSVISRPVRFDVDDVGFYVAMRLAGAVTKTFWSPLQEKQILAVADSTENHRLFDRMGLRTFYVPDAAATPQQLQELVNVLRTVFEIKYVSSNAQKSTITVRAPQAVLNAATVFMEGLGSSAPEVMLDVKIYEVSHTLMKAFGMQIPYQFNLFNIPAIAQQFTLGGGQSIQDLINQLIASGGINQANSSALQALLAQLGQGGSSLLTQSFVTFGNGLTLFGVTMGQLTATLSRNESQLQSLQHVTLRAAQGKDATVNLGSRYPIVNASFAPIFNTPAISQAISNNSFVAPVPSFSYEDLGINMKIKPVVHGTSDVSLTFELKVRALTGASANGVPVIGNREYTGSINVMNEQSTVVAGQITSTEQKSLSGFPGIGQIPVLSHTLASNNVEKDDNELLIVVTPHIIRMAENESSEIWMTGIK